MMSEKSRENRIREVVACCVTALFDCVKKEDVKDSTRFVEDLGCDFLDKVEFGMLIEQAFTTAVPSDIETKAKTVGDIVDFLLKRDATKPLNIDDRELLYYK